MSYGVDAGGDFDVVVVGSGSAGCIVAARLAELSSASVLLLEAGPDLRANPPAGMHDGWVTYREYDWGYESEPNDRGETEPVHRGRLVGGTSWRTRFMMRGSSHNGDSFPQLFRISTDSQRLSTSVV